MSNKTYLNTELAKLANSQHEQYEQLFTTSISESVNNSHVYRESSIGIQACDIDVKRCLEDYNIEFDDLTTNQSLFKHWTAKTAVMNFASYTRPGGGFLKGAHAQEESLCMGTTLYNVLERFTPEYDFNYKSKKTALYTNFAIYSPNILFMNQKPYKVGDVITIAAPNVGAHLDNGNTMTVKEQYDAVKDRIKFALDICNKEGAQTLILGAFGCGVFRNDPVIVAEAFRDVLAYNKYNFKSVIFSVPDVKKLKIFSDIIK